MSPLVPIAILVAYLLGSLPWALWVGRAARGVDIRRLGSGNLGATNVYRVLGPKLGVLVLVLDMGKGLAGVLTARALAGDVFPGGPQVAGLAGGAAAVLGHVFTVFAGFRGGKGVATAAGAMLAVAPVTSLVAIAIFALVLALTRRVSAASVAAALAWIAIAWLGPMSRTPSGAITAAIGTAIGILLVVRHIPNLRRLARGEEPGFEFRSPKPPSNETSA